MTSVNWPASSRASVATARQRDHPPHRRRAPRQQGNETPLAGGETREFAVPLDSADDLGNVRVTAWPELQVVLLDGEQRAVARLLELIRGCEPLEPAELTPATLSGLVRGGGARSGADSAIDPAAPPDRRGIRPAQATETSAASRHAVVPAQYSDAEPLPPPFASPQLPPAPGQFVFNFHEAPWDLVLRRFAEAAGLALQIDTLPTEPLTYYDSAEYSPTEALDILNGYLIQSGYILIRRDRFLVVLEIGEAGVPSHLIPQVSPEELEQRGRNEMVSVVIPMVNLDVSQAAADVTPLLSPLGKVVPLANSNNLLISDIGANVRRIYQLLWRGTAAFGIARTSSTN